nr:hypothetical protein [Streptomyces chattanoogensis]
MTGNQVATRAVFGYRHVCGDGHCGSDGDGGRTGQGDAAGFGADSVVVGAGPGRSGGGSQARLQRGKPRIGHP